MANKTPVDETAVNNLFLDSTISNNDHLMTLMQIDWLQPVYTLTFSNGLIACLIFIGIGSLLDVGFVMKRPYVSAIIALFAELGTLLVLPLASLFGYDLKDAASIALVGGADGPMVLFASLKLSPHLFVPITVVAYMYLGLAYGGFPYLVKLLVPKKLQAIEMPPDDPKLKITSGQKLTFAVVACVLLSFLFPVASPLFFSLFLGIAIRESGLEKFQHLVSEIVLYGSTLTLGLLLGVLCEAKTIMDPKVLPLLIFGMAAADLRHGGAGALRSRRNPGRLFHVLRHPREVQPGHRHCGSQLRALHRESRAEVRHPGEPECDHHALRAGGEYLRRDYNRDHRGHLHQSAAEFMRRCSLWNKHGLLWGKPIF